MTDKKNVAGNAAKAADSVVSQCCAVGSAGFATSENTLVAEYAQMENDLAEAQNELIFQAEENQIMWIIAEQKIQNLGTSGLDGATIANEAAKLVIAEAQATEAEFGIAEDTLLAEIDNSEQAILTAETTLFAESAEFSAEACP